MKKIEEFIKKYELINSGEKVVAGISGGADSVCLLVVLKKTVGADNVIAVHVNHCLRGDEAKRDENFVRKLCEKFGIKCIVKAVDVNELAKTEGLSCEEAGRLARYRIFEEIRIKENADKIAVAHNSNDLAETFLLNLSRGSDIAGLTGIKPVNGKIIRPLLQTSREEIEAILLKSNEIFVTDSTNLSMAYARNRIRNNVIRDLQSINTKAVEHINETAEKLYKIEKYLSKESEKAYNKNIAVIANEQENGQAISVSDKISKLFINETLLREDDVIIDKVIYLALKNLGKAKDLTSLHVELVKNLFKNQVGKRLNLPYGITAYRDYKGVLLSRRGDALRTENFQIKLPRIKMEIEEVPAIKNVEFYENTIKITFMNGTIKNLIQNSFTRWFDYDRITGDVMLRTKKIGDHITISKDGDRKRLKNYFIDNKIPSEKRDYIPLVTAGSDVLWIIGYRTGEGKLITKNTKNILKIEIIPEEKDVRKNNNLTE